MFFSLSNRRLSCKINTSHVNCGKKEKKRRRSEFWRSVIYWECFFEILQKLGKAAACPCLPWKGLQKLNWIHTFTIILELFEFFQSWNSISPFAIRRLPSAQEILSAHFLSVRKPYYAFSLPLMGPHANLPLLPTSLNFMKLSMSCSKVSKLSQMQLTGGQMFVLSEETGKTYGSP